MNRRNFLAGLLASTAAVPLAPAFAADMGIEPLMAWDVASGPDATAYVMRRSAMSYVITTEHPFIAAARQAWGPMLAEAVERMDARTFWLDEASDLTPSMFDVLRARDILDAQPVPSEGREILYGGAPGGAMLPAPSEAQPHVDPQPDRPDRSDSHPARNS